MADQDDIFGKIDALLEKRVGFGLTPPSEADDFPVLTEVVSPGKGEHERRVGERRMGERRQADRRQSPMQRPQAATDPILASSPMWQQLEERLADLFIHQQLRLETALRKVLHEEIARLREELSKR